MMRTELGHKNAINNAEGKEGKGMLATTGAKSELEMRREKLVKEFLIQRKKAFKFKNLGTVGNWEGKGKNKERNEQVREFRAKVDGMVYTCYEIQGKIYLKLMYFSSIKYGTKVPDEFELVDLSWLKQLEKSKSNCVHLNRVQYIIVEKNTKGKSFVYIKKIIATELRLLHFLYVEKDKFKLVAEDTYITMDNLFEYKVEVNIKNLQYVEFRYNHLLFTGEFNTNNRLKVGDIGYRELVQLKEEVKYSLIYDSVYDSSNNVYFLDRNFFNTDVFLDDCNYKRIEAFEVQDSLDNFGLDRIDKEETMEIIDEDGYFGLLRMNHKKKIFYHYSDDRLTMTIIFYDKGLNSYHEVIFKLNEVIKEKNNSKNIIETHLCDTIQDETDFRDNRKKLIDYYCKCECLFQLENNGFALCNIDDYFCWYKYDDKHDWLILNNIKPIEGESTENLKIPVYFDVMYSDNILKKYTGNINLSNIQYLMTDVDIEKNMNRLYWESICDSHTDIRNYKASYIKAEKLKLTQMLDKKGNLLKLYYSTYKKKGMDYYRQFDLFYRLSYAHTNFPSLQYSNIDSIDYRQFLRMYINIYKIKEGDLGYEEISAHRKKTAARIRQAVKG